MEIQQFIKDLEEQFDELEEGAIQPNTVFKNIDEYSSLTAMCIMGMVDSKYGVTLSGDILETCATVEDLFYAVKEAR